MIRFAKKEDTKEIVLLWEKCFKKDNFSKWYFDNQYKPENTILDEDNGVITSMLQRLPYEIKNIGQATYIFGACTHPDFRNQGLMAKLLEHSENLDKGKNIKASILIPQEKSLFDFYAKFGYEPKVTIFNKKVIKQNARVHSYKFRQCKADETNKLNGLYEKVLENTNYIKRDENFWATQFSMFESLGGNIFALEHEENIVGYAFTWNDNGVIIQELLGQNNDINKIICYEVMEYYKVDSAELFSPTGSVSEIPFGCIKSYQPIENGLPVIMNLMFN